MGRIGLLVVLLLVAAVLMPTVLLLAFLMLPSGVVFMLDKGRPKYLSLTMAMPNFCGAMPAVIKLWEHGQTYAVSTSLMFSPGNIVMAYVAAALGVGLFLSVPPIVKIYLSSASDRKVEELVKVQNELVDAWGQEVIGANPPPGESEAGFEDDEGNSQQG
ncbi:hypothetical protein [Kiloniella sp. b19]|uniref:hypothetical protein n=1 Tax=Kiloniella sp. GXU_MW_B19 TaxID=3141326 RepID=UPI0031D4083A